MNKFLKGIMIFSVFAAIFAVASIIFAINTKPVTNQYLELINTKSLHGKQLVRLVKQPDGTLLVETVSPTSEDVKLPSGSVTEGSPGGPAGDTPVDGPEEPTEQPELNGDTIDFSKCPYKNIYTYMGWQMITSKSSAQYKLREKYYPESWDASNKKKGDPDAFDSEGFAMIEGRYVVATTSKMGSVGQMIDVYLDTNDGRQLIIPCVIGDVKSSGDSNWSEWGHKYGGNSVSTIEFIVDYAKWYPKHANPGTSSCRPGWAGKITKIVQGGMK